MSALPEWIDKEAWSGFIEMRRAMKKIPFTPRAEALILAELYKLRDAGQDPNACLDQSTLNGWRDVYPVKDKAKKSYTDESRDRLAIALGLNNVTPIRRIG